MRALITGGAGFLGSHLADAQTRSERQAGLRHHEAALSH